MAIAHLTPMTADDLAEYPDDGLRHEIINGELYVAPAPLISHQRLVARIFKMLDAAANATNAGEVFLAPLDVRLSDYDVVQPDLLFIAKDRLSILHGDEYAEGAPDIVIEILSPSTRMIDLVRKAALYAKAGVAEYWTVDPARNVLAINVLREGRYVPGAPDADGLVRSAMLSGVVIDPDALFAGLPD
jgi:Uma2 family endonuclease